MYGFLPPVLRPGAILPRPGVSGLPKSLEAKVPVAMRYWEARDQVECRKRHNVLATSGLFTDSNVKLVGGVLTLVAPVEALKPTETLVYRVPEPASEVRKSLSMIFDRELPIRKSVNEERYFLASVLRPRGQDNPDRQKEWYGEEEIRKAMFRFMAYVLKNLRGPSKVGEGQSGAGVMHSEVANDRLLMVENYQALAPFETEGGLIHKGEWVQGYLVPCDELWEGVKQKRFRGLSIEGRTSKVKAA